MQKVSFKISKEGNKMIGSVLRLIKTYFGAWKWKGKTSCQGPTGITGKTGISFVSQVMRKIKFRMWHNEWKQMIYLTNGSKIDTYFLIITADDVVLEFDNSENHKKHFYQSLNEIIPMQFTDLLDKNGKEIYEGDIVNIDDTLRGGYIDFRDMVIFRDGEFTLKGNDKGFSLFRILNAYPKSWIEIIGNIYENPELLKT